MKRTIFIWIHIVGFHIFFHGLIKCAHEIVGRTAADAITRTVGDSAAAKLLQRLPERAGFHPHVSEHNAHNVTVPVNQKSIRRAVGNLERQGVGRYQSEIHQPLQQHPALQHGLGNPIQFSDPGHGGSHHLSELDDDFVRGGTKKSFDRDWAGIETSSDFSTGNGSKISGSSVDEVSVNLVSKSQSKSLSAFAKGSGLGLQSGRSGYSPPFYGKQLDSEALKQIVQQKAAKDAAQRAVDEINNTLSVRDDAFTQVSNIDISNVVKSQRQSEFKKLAESNQQSFNKQLDQIMQKYVASGKGVTSEVLSGVHKKVEQNLQNALQQIEQQYLEKPKENQGVLQNLVEKKIQEATQQVLTDAQELFKKQVDVIKKERQGLVKQTIKREAIRRKEIANLIKNEEKQPFDKQLQEMVQSYVSDSSGVTSESLQDTVQLIGRMRQDTLKTLEQRLLTEQYSSENATQKIKEVMKNLDEETRRLFRQKVESITTEHQKLVQQEIQRRSSQFKKLTEAEEENFKESLTELQQTYVNRRNGVSSKSLDKVAEQVVKLRQQALQDLEKQIVEQKLSKDAVKQKIDDAMSKVVEKAKELFQTQVDAIKVQRQKSVEEAVQRRTVEFKQLSESGEQDFTKSLDSVMQRYVGKKSNITNDDLSKVRQKVVQLRQDALRKLEQQIVKNPLSKELVEKQIQKATQKVVKSADQLFQDAVQTIKAHRRETVKQIAEIIKKEQEKPFDQQLNEIMKGYLNKDIGVTSKSLQGVYQQVIRMRQDVLNKLQDRWVKQQLSPDQAQQRMTEIMERIDVEAKRLFQQKVDQQKEELQKSIAKSKPSPQQVQVMKRQQEDVSRPKGQGKQLLDVPQSNKPKLESSLQRVEPEKSTGEVHNELPKIEKPEGSRSLTNSSRQELSKMPDVVRGARRNVVDKPTDAQSEQQQKLTDDMSKDLTISSYSSKDQSSLVKALIEHRTKQFEELVKLDTTKFTDLLQQNMQSYVDVHHGVTQDALNSVVQNIMQLRQDVLKPIQQEFVEKNLSDKTIQEKITTATQSLLDQANQLFQQQADLIQARHEQELLKQQAAKDIARAQELAAQEEAARELAEQQALAKQRALELQKEQEARDLERRKQEQELQDQQELERKERALAEQVQKEVAQRELARQQAEQENMVLQQQEAARQEAEKVAAQEESLRALEEQKELAKKRELELHQNSSMDSKKALVLQQAAQRQQQELEKQVAELQKHRLKRLEDDKERERQEQEKPDERERKRREERERQEREEQNNNRTVDARKGVAAIAAEKLAEEQQKRADREASSKQMLLDFEQKLKSVLDQMKDKKLSVQQVEQEIRGLVDQMHKRMLQLVQNKKMNKDEMDLLLKKMERKTLQELSVLAQSLKQQERLVIDSSKDLSVKQTAEKSREENITKGGIVQQIVGHVQSTNATKGQDKKDVQEAHEEHEHELVEQLADRLHELFENSHDHAEHNVDIHAKDKDQAKDVDVKINDNPKANDADDKKPKESPHDDHDATKDVISDNVEQDIRAVGMKIAKAMLAAKVVMVTKTTIVPWIQEYNLFDALELQRPENMQYFLGYVQSCIFDLQGEQEEITKQLATMRSAGIDTAQQLIDQNKNYVSMKDFVGIVASDDHYKMIDQENPYAMQYNLGYLQGNMDWLRSEKNEQKN